MSKISITFQITANTQLVSARHMTAPIKNIGAPARILFGGETDEVPPVEPCVTASSIQPKTDEEVHSQRVRDAKVAEQPVCNHI